MKTELGDTDRELTLMRPARLFLCRHCRTPWNEAGRLQGRKDVPLSPAGVEEAKRVAAGLSRLNLDGIVSSPAKRAMQTSQLFSSLGNFPLSSHPGLLELDHGEWEGEYLLRLRQDHSFLKWMADPASQLIPGSAETVFEAVERFGTAIDEIARTRRRVLIVAHKHISALFLAQRLRRDLSTFQSMIADQVKPRIIPKAAYKL